MGWASCFDCGGMDWLIELPSGTIYCGGCNDRDDPGCPDGMLSDLKVVGDGGPDIGPVGWQTEGQGES